MIKFLDKFNLQFAGLLQESALAFFVRGLGAISAFLMSLAVARVLSVTEAGFFFLAITVISVLTPVGLVGTNLTSLRFIGAWAAEEDWARSRAVARITWWWSGSLLAVGSLLLWFVAHWVGIYVFDKPAFGEVLQYMAPGLFMMGVWVLLSAQLQALRRVLQSIVLASIGVPLGVACGVWLLPVSSALDVALLYVLVGVLMVALGFYWWHRAISPAEPASIDKMALWSSCVPLWVMSVASMGTMWAGQFVAGTWVGTEEVARLVVAQRTANLVSFILVAVNFVVAPRFAALYKQQRFKELHGLALHSVRLMTLVGAPVVLLLGMFNEFVMSLFGTEFTAAGPLLVILAVGQFINVVTGSVGYLLTMSGHERDMRTAVLIAGLFAVVAALLLVPLSGVVGAALATAIAVSIQNLVAAWFVRRRLGINIMTAWQEW